MYSRARGICLNQHPLSINFGGQLQKRCQTEERTGQQMAADLRGLWQRFSGPWTVKEPKVPFDPDKPLKYRMMRSDTVLASRNSLPHYQVMWRQGCTGRPFLNNTKTSKFISV